MAYNKKAHLLTNIEAVRIAFALGRDNRRATDSERDILRKYSGFDGEVAKTACVYAYAGL